MSANDPKRTSRLVNPCLSARLFSLRRSVMTLAHTRTHSGTRCRCTIDLIQRRSERCDLGLGGGRSGGES